MVVLSSPDYYWFDFHSWICHEFAANSYMYESTDIIIYQPPASAFHSSVRRE